MNQNKIVVLLGFPGQGILELLHYIDEEHGLKRIKAYTTKQPSRFDYLDYKFISTTEFNRREANGEFGMVRIVDIPTVGDYVTIQHKYALAKKDLLRGGVRISNWDSYTDLLDLKEGNVIAFLLEVELDAIFNPNFDEHDSGDTLSKLLRDRFLVDENKILLNKSFIDEMAKIYKIYKINANLQEKEIHEFVDSVLKEN